MKKLQSLLMLLELISGASGFIKKICNDLKDSEIKLNPFNELEDIENKYKELSEIMKDFL